MLLIENLKKIRKELIEERGAVLGGGNMKEELCICDNCGEKIRIGVKKTGNNVLITPCSCILDRIKNPEKRNKEKFIDKYIKICKEHNLVIGIEGYPEEGEYDLVVQNAKGYSEDGSFDEIRQELLG